MTNTARITAELITTDQTKIPVYTKEIVLPMDNNASGKVGFTIGMKVPEVFGRYSSLEISLYLEGPANPDEFESFVNRYAERVLVYEKEIVDRVRQVTGQEVKE